ncbi:MAG: hypothetical protein HY692_08855 [Cyanobacteria bacterium NC_groundwater_1444_Ag_S-0.65um_54_12]|nr:hypothetical protein [Cyanobacteria bacterium NC_groundwater_1444_Ag_S-0.65um_54_12]
MQKKYFLGMRSPSSASLAVSALLVFGNAPALANEDGIPTENTTLRLPDGRFVNLERLSQHETQMTLEKRTARGRKILWKRVYEQEYDRLWDEAFFVPIKPNRYIVDLDRNGTWEIGIATYDGGNSLYRYALIFSVKKDALVFYGTSPKQIDLVMPTSIFPK